MHGIDPNGILIAIAAFFNAVPSIVAAYYAFHARREALNAKKSSQRNQEKLTTIEKATNGITDRLIKTTAEAAYAKGKEDERQKE